MLRIWRSCTTLARERMWALLGQYCSHKRLRMRSACWQGDAAFSHADKVLSEVPQAPVMCPLTSFPGCLTRPAYVRLYTVSCNRHQQLLGALQCAGTGGTSLL